MTKPCTFCDRGYSHAAGLSQLQSLQLGFSWLLGVGRENMSFIANLTQLTKISLTKCFVDDEGLQPLSSLVHLRLL